MWNNPEIIKITQKILKTKIVIIIWVKINSIMFISKFFVGHILFILARLSNVLFKITSFKLLTRCVLSIYASHCYYVSSFKSKRMIFPSWHPAIKIRPSGEKLTMCIACVAFGWEIKDLEISVIVSPNFHRCIFPKWLPIARYFLSFVRSIRTNQKWFLSSGSWKLWIFVTVSDWIFMGSFIVAPGFHLTMSSSLDLEINESSFSQIMLWVKNVV